MPDIELLSEEEIEKEEKEFKKKYKKFYKKIMDQFDKFKSLNPIFDTTIEVYQEELQESLACLEADITYYIKAQGKEFIEVTGEWKKRGTEGYRRIWGEYPVTRGDIEKLLGEKKTAKGFKK